MLNKIYGIANEDLNTISKNNSLSRTGIKHGVSKYMYIFSSCPDFFNRMTLFIAKMIEDDCLEAHHLDDQGNLVYDIKTYQLPLDMGSRALILFTKQKETSKIYPRKYAIIKKKPL